MKETERKPCTSSTSSSERVGERKTSTSYTVDMELVNVKENPDTRKKKFMVGKIKPKEISIREGKKKEKRPQRFNQSWMIGLFRKTERELVA